MPNISGRYMLDNTIDFETISNSFTQDLSHAGGFLTILAPGIYTPADGQYTDMVFDTIVFDAQGDFIYYGNQERMLEVYDARGGGWRDQSFRDVEFLPDTPVDDLLFRVLTENANNDDPPYLPRWQSKAKRIDLNKFLMDKVDDALVAGLYYDVRVVANTDNEYFKASDSSTAFEFKATEATDTEGGLYDENGVNIVSWHTLVEFYEMFIHEVSVDGETGNPLYGQEKWDSYSYEPDEYAPNYYEPNAYWLGNIILRQFSEARTLVIPEGVTYVREHLLANISFCGQLQNSTLPIHTLYLPSTLKTIGRDAFLGGNLTNIYYNGTAKDWSQITFVNRYSNPCAAAHTSLKVQHGGIENFLHRYINISNLFRYRHDRDNEFADFRYLPNFYVKSQPSDKYYELLTHIDMRGGKSNAEGEVENFAILDYAFAGCGKYVEKISLDPYVRIIGFNAFDLFVVNCQRPQAGFGYVLLPVSFFYDGTLVDWMGTSLSSKWSNPGYRARYIEFSGDEICGVDDEDAEVQCPIKYLEIPVNNSLELHSYIFAGWQAEVLKFGIGLKTSSGIGYECLKDKCFYDATFGTVIMDCTPECWDRLGQLNHKTSSPIFETVPYSQIYMYDDQIQEYVPAETTVYIPQRATSIKAYKYAESDIEKVYIPPSVQLIHRDAFEYCDSLNVIDCTACTNGLPKIRRPLSHPNLKWDTDATPNYIPSPITQRRRVRDRVSILIPRDRTGEHWEYLGHKAFVGIEGRLNSWESCNIVHASSNLSTSTAITIKVYDGNTSLFTVALRNIPGMTVDWGDGHITHKSTTSRLSEDDYISHDYYKDEQRWTTSKGYDARTVRIYDIDYIPDDFFKLDIRTDDYTNAKVGVGTLTIANGVKSVGLRAFDKVLSYKNLDNIYISNTVTFIDALAFGSSIASQAYVVFEDVDQYKWYEVYQKDEFASWNASIPFDVASCFTTRWTAEEPNRNANMLGRVLNEGNVVYRYSTAKSFSTLAAKANSSAEKFIGKGAKEITIVSTSPSISTSSLTTDYNQSTGVLKVKVNGGTSGTTYNVKYSYILPDYLNS